MKKASEKAKELITSEINDLETTKANKITRFQDDLHNYEVIKNQMNYKFVKQNVVKKIMTKKAQIKVKINQVESSYALTINKLKSRDQTNFYWLNLTKIFRRNGFNKVIGNILKILNENKLMIIVLAIAIIAASIKPIFFTKYNILNNILKNNITIGVMAIGMTFVIITKGIDLSIGSILGFAGIVAMGMLLGGMPTLLAFAIGLVIAMLIGIAQGFLIAWIKLPPFIVTLVGLLAIRGGIYIYAKGAPKTNIGNKTFNFINNEDLLGIPILVVLFLLITISGIIILKYTTFGRKVYSVGDNVEAAHFSGINTKKIITICYLISGLTAGLAAFVFSSRISSAGPNSGKNYELEVIAAVVLGGTSLSGGKGGVGKTFLGWLVISILSNALILLGFDSNYQLVFKGLVILLAVILDKNFAILSKLKHWKNKLF